MSRRPANAWPWWKLRAYLPDGRRWDELRLVCLAEPAHPWQFQTPTGRPAGVGLFANRASALKWAATHCQHVICPSEQVVKEPR
ncbi:MAG: hypothetical protein ACHQ0J_01850 [Candidatus Dormibacterales bacterium]